MANFFLICGISGGGKSFLTKKISEKNPNIIILDSDEYYKEINGDERIHKNTFDVWHTLFKDIHNKELEGKDVLLTSNALTVAQRRQLIEWFPTFNHHLIWVISPLDKCIEANKTRYRTIPEEILIKHWYKMEFPNASEADWDSITHITNCWTDKYIIFKLKNDIEKILKI